MGLVSPNTAIQKRSIMINIGQLWDFWVFSLHHCQQVADMRFLSEVNLRALSWQINAEN